MTVTTTVEPGPPRSRKRRAAFWSGVLLSLAGLGLLGYIGWEFYGTNWMSHRHQQQAVKEIREGWVNGERLVHTDFGDSRAIIEIPRFGKDYQIPVFQGTSDNALAAGFGHFTGTAGPGKVGNYALAAHRVTHGEPLRDMPSLQVGDEVEVVTRATTYVYQLTTGGDDLVVPFTSTWVTDPLPHNPDGGPEPAQHREQRLITLTTCAELFHTDNRLVAFGILERQVPTR